MTSNFNLIEDPWIPVVYNHCAPGQTKQVGLRELYEGSEQIADLAATPSERVALMRLLLCITQAALDGPRDEPDWLECGERIVKASCDYLQKWKDRFNLFGDRPFLQVPCLNPRNETASAWASCDKLHFILSAGNNHTLFDREALAGGRAHEPGALALALLTFQCFSPGGTIGQAKWGFLETRRNSTHAPCLQNSPLFTILRGPNLLFDIHLNLIAKDRLKAATLEFGRPVWELDDLPSPDRDEANQLTRTYLGRLVPLARAVRIHTDCIRCIIADGYRYPQLPEGRDPMATVVPSRRIRGEQEYRYLSFSLNRHPWRDLHAVLTLAPGDALGGPLALAHIKQNQEDQSDTVTLWVGGLAAEQAKLLDCAEWIFSVPRVLLDSRSLEVYRQGVEHAEIWENKLRDAIKAYCGQLKMEEIEKKSHTERAVLAFWGTLDNKFWELMDLATEARDPSPWQERCRKTALLAYRATCPTETPRQLEAHMEGYRMLGAHKGKRKGAVV